MAGTADEKQPVIVTAMQSTISICAGNVYQFREYTNEYYERYGERPPRRPEGTIEGVGGVAPCCVAYPLRLTKPLEMPDYLAWL